MDQLVERCAGLDVHRDTVVATVRRPRPGGGRAAQTLTFSTTTAELTALGDWLLAEEVDLVGMESTGVYWKPVYFLLEERIPQVWLLNAEHLHNVPGRKTDVADSAWIAQLLEHGLVAPSFVPPAPIRELRDLTRHRRVLIEERTRVIQRLEKVLQESRPGARFPDCSGSVSPGRSPNPPCASRRNGLSTETAVMRGSAPRGSGCSLGSGTG